MRKHIVCNSCTYADNLRFWHPHALDDVYNVCYNCLTYTEIPWQFLLRNPNLLNKKYLKKIGKMAYEEPYVSGWRYLFAIDKYQDLTDEQLKTIIKEIDGAEANISKENSVSEFLLRHLDLIEDDDYVCATCDGAGKSKEESARRISRVVCADLDILSMDDIKEMADYILNNLNGLTFPGWEPERMAKLDELFELYRPVTKEKLWDNLKYFLEAIMPTCKECDIKMAIHMDDPPWDIFGLPRLLVDAESVDRFVSMVDDPYNCLTLCSGSLNANPNNNVADIVRKHCDRIAFAHIRNVKHFENGDFSEASHRDCDGDTRILDVLKAYHDCGFEGYIRPDHGRHLWTEGPGNVRPGYGLYDRALGIMYMLGVWDMLDKIEGK
jgi:D-mannonate dehydratase